MATAKKLVKPNVLRGQIFDKLAAAFGDSVLGVYENKLRVEIIDEDGNVIQFSLAPVVHKTLVDAEECDKLVPIADQVAAYEAAKAEKDAKDTGKKNSGKKDKDTADKPADEPDKNPPVDLASVGLTDEDKVKLNSLTKALADGEF